jgi:hypothetical protein
MFIFDWFDVLIVFLTAIQYGFVLWALIKRQNPLPYNCIIALNAVLIFIMGFNAQFFPALIYGAIAIAAYFLKPRKH